MSVRDRTLASRIDMQNFFNRLSASKTNQLRSVMNASKTSVGIAPEQVVAPKIANPDTMRETRQETAWVTETAEAKRREVALRNPTKNLMLIGGLGLIYLLVS